MSTPEIKNGEPFGLTEGEVACTRYFASNIKGGDLKRIEELFRNCLPV